MEVRVAYAITDFGMSTYFASSIVYMLICANNGMRGANYGESKIWYLG